MEGARHDTNHYVGVVVQHEGLPEHPWVAVESGVPEGITYNGRRSFRGVVIIARSEHSSAESRHAQQWEHPRRH